MEEFQPEELAVFLDDLHRSPDGKTSLMLRYALESGYTKEFAVHYNPFQYEGDARAMAATLPMAHSVLVVLFPKANFSARLYQLKRNTAEPNIQYDRAQIHKVVGFHNGFHGLPDDPELVLKFMQDSAGKERFECALTLTAATALYRALGSCMESLYVMEKGWNHAYLLTPTYLPTTACC